MQKRIVLDLDYCVGCRSCVAACQSAFKGEGRIGISEIETMAYLPLACRHCEDPLCAKACPQEAITKDDKTGIVRRASFLCIGCGSCIYACPFGVLDSPLIRHLAQKCDLCKDREDGPRCVATCVSGALKFLTDEEIEKIEVGRKFVSRLPFLRRR
ncbi:MAG: 4Fe-4S dicluster domain-containing protein [bacterium]|nr:4Fe-4S dicluster domain-containing protein [bacterium]